MAAKKSRGKKSSSSLPPPFEWQKALSGPLSPVYLVHGEAAYFTQKAVEWLRTRALGDAIPEFNFDRFDAQESQFDLSRLMNALDTQPMMAERRVVLVKSSEVLNKIAKSQLTPLIEWCLSPPSDVCLIFEGKTRLDQSRALMKALSKSKQTLVFEAGPMNEDTACRWLSSLAEERKLTCSSDVLSLIYEATEGKVSELADTMDRLALYLAPRNEIQSEDVIAMLPLAKMHTTVWTLLDALALKDTAKVLTLARSLLRDGQEPIGLLSLIHRRVRELTAACVTLQLGGGEALLAQSLGVSGYAAKRIIKLAHDRRTLTLKQLAYAYQLVAQSDQVLKGSKIDPELALERLLMGICIQK